MAKRRTTTESTTKVPPLGAAKVVGWFGVKVKPGVRVMGHLFPKDTTWDAIKVSVAGGLYGGKGSRPRVYYLIPAMSFSDGLRAVDIVSAEPLTEDVA